MPNRAHDYYGPNETQRFAEGFSAMVERLPGHAYLITAAIGAGALWLVASQIVSIFIP